MTRTTLVGTVNMSGAEVYQTYFHMVLTGKIPLFAWDTYFYIGTPVYALKNFTVCMGCLFSQRDAHIYCENGHPDAYIHV